MHIRMFPVSLDQLNWLALERTSMLRSLHNCSGIDGAVGGCDVGDGDMALEKNKYVTLVYKRICIRHSYLYQNMHTTLSSVQYMREKLSYTPERIFLKR